MRIANAAACGLFVLLTSCLFETADPDTAGPGYLNLQIQLKANANALLKSSAGDTVFDLDSVVIELITSGAATSVNTYPITGRADLGSIAVSQKTFTLASLRTWKAVIYSIDTTLNPPAKDTVHKDSVTFTINPGDTATVAKAIDPRFSILRARLVSNNPVGITNNVKFVRIKVGDVTRDSTPVGPAFRDAEFGNAGTGYLVGDTGTIYRTVNSGANWAAAVSGTANSLYSVSMTGTNAGYAVGLNGTVIKTSTGTAWAPIISNTTNDLYGTWFTGANNGWAVGEGGRITKTTNGTSFTAQTSGTTTDLHAIHCNSSNNCNAVGKDGVIRRTTNGGTNWTAQASPTTAQLNGVYMTGNNSGIAVGNGGVILRYGSGTWSLVTSPVAEDLYNVWFDDANNGTISGAAGTLLTTTNAGAEWAQRASGTVQDLYAVCWNTSGTVILAAGALGTISAGTDNAAFSRGLIGTKSFDMLLAWKYLAPNVSHSLKLEAIDTLHATVVRGYQALKTVNLSPGKDTTVTPNSSLTACGGSNPACQ